MCCFKKPTNKQKRSCDVKSRAFVLEIVGNRYPRSRSNLECVQYEHVDERKRKAIRSKSLSVVNRSKKEST